MLNDFYVKEYMQIIESFDKHMYPLINTNISDLMLLLDDLKDNEQINKRNLLNQTKIAQPAILLHSYLNFCKFKNFFKDEYNIKYLFGPSLGEISALTSSEALSLNETGVLLFKRGLFMQESCPANLGSMLNIVGDVSKNQKLFEDFTTKLEKEEKDFINISAVYSKRLLVVSGKTYLIDLCSAFFKSNSIACRKLITSAAFHSKLMEGGKNRFKEYLLNQITFKKPQIEILSTVDRLYKHNENYNELRLKDLLVDQFTEKIDLLNCFEYCQQNEIDVYDLNKRKFINFAEYL